MSDKQKSIEQIIMEFEHELRRWHNLESPITRIDLTPKAFDVLVMDLYRKTQYYSIYRPSDCCDLKLNGIRINARDRK